MEAAHTQLHALTSRPLSSLYSLMMAVMFSTSPACGRTALNQQTVIALQCTHQAWAHNHTLMHT